MKALRATWVLGGVVFALLSGSGAAMGAEFNGFAREDFEFAGRKAVVVKPAEAAEGKPWIWRARFFGAFPAADVALLGRGYHVVWVDVGGLFGNADALKAFDAFYAHLRKAYGLAERATLEGFSRGGLPAMNWAIANPEKVNGIYLDAPVLDFRSWPGGRGAGKGSPKSWDQLLKVYGLTEEEALGYEHGPLAEKGLKVLVKAGIPILTVCGDSDDVVPYVENSAILVERYRALGGKIEVILKEGVGHHPHSLEDPAPIVAFVEGAGK